MDFLYSDGLKTEFEFKGVRLLLINEEAGVWRLISPSENGFDRMGASQILSRDLGEDYDKTPAPVVTDNNGTGLKVTGSDGTYVCIDQSAIEIFNSKGNCIRKITDIRTDSGSSAVTLHAFHDERFYGTGERFDTVDQRGRKLTLYAVDRWCQTKGNSYIPIPVLVSSHSDIIFMNRYECSVFDICSSDKNSIIIDQKYAPVDLYFFISDSVKDNISAYCRLTGFAPKPPEWAFGTFVCRYHPEFSDKYGVFAMMESMEKNGFPWSAVILEGFGAFNKDNLSELREICEKVHAAGKKVMIYERCGRFPEDAVRLAGLDDSYAVASDKGVLLEETVSNNMIDNFSRKKMKCIDITSRRSLSKWEELMNIYVKDMGVEGAKIDFCEQFPDRPDIKFSDDRNPMSAHHWYPTLYNILQHRLFMTRPEGGINYSRGGGIGAQRYPFVWAGDQRREFFFLKPVLRAVLSLGLSGVPFVSWDMAGYQPSFNPVDRRHENRVFIRGLEFSAFSPNMQTHGKVKRPYDFDEHTKAVYRAYSNLHECMIPYISEQAEISCKTGLPVMRHLFLYDSSDKKCFDTEDEYMFGEALLVAPVLNRRNFRNVYLPKGQWTNIFDGRTYEGGRTILNNKVPLEMIPVFILADSGPSCIDNVLEKASPIIEEIRNLCSKKL